MKIIFALASLAFVVALTVALATQFGFAGYVIAYVALVFWATAGRSTS